MAKSNEWYTPAKYIEAARTVMGGIDLDPASCEMANQVVRATRYYTQEENGLMQPWYGRVWLNPPFGRTSHNQSNQVLFVERLIRAYTRGTVKSAIVLVTAKPACSYFRYLWQYPICFADHHVQFHRPDGKFKDQMYGVCFVYLGPNNGRFTEIFSRFGRIAVAIDAPKPKPVALELWEAVA